MMFSQYIQPPYFVLPFGLAKPSLIIAIAYVLVLTAIILIGTKKQKLKFQFRPIGKIKPGERNKIIFSLVSFVILIISCIIFPSLLDDETIIISISKVYLQYEALAFGVVLLFLLTSILNKSNKSTQIKVSNKILNVLIWVSIGTGLLTGEIDYTFWQNIIVIACSGIIILLFLITDILDIEEKDNNKNRFDLISYAPVKSFQELFPQHKIYAEDIVNIIKTSSADPLSICVSGAWGTGKTSVVNGVVDMLNDDKKRIYDFIYINALELDNKQAMMHYLFSQIKEILVSHGVYVGVDSELKDFISSSAGSLTSNSIGNYIHKKFFQENDDYRFQKIKFENLLQRTYKEGKLIVIVDDIERCDKELAQEYLFLIKEVATMQNCVSIFVTDYNMLNSIVNIENDPKKDDGVQDSEFDFLSKFFNYRIKLRAERPEDVFEFYDNRLKSDEFAFSKISDFGGMLPKEWYHTVITGIKGRLQEQIDESKKYHTENSEIVYGKRIEELNNLIILFQEIIQNSRNIVKFYNVFRNNILICSEYLFSSGDKDNNETKKYIYTRNIGQVIYVLSFVEIFMPSEHHRLIEKGAQYVESTIYGTKEVVSTDRALLIELINGMVYGKYFSRELLDSYIKQDIRNFIDNFLSNKKKLPQLVNLFSTQEEKWLAEIINFNEKELKDHWIDMVQLILQKSPYIDPKFTNETRIKLFTILLNFAEQQIKKGEWTSDDVFNIFESGHHTDRFLPMGRGMLTTFWKHLNKSKIYKKPSKDLAYEIKFFPFHYTYERMQHIRLLARYLMPLNDDNARCQP